MKRLVNIESCNPNSLLPNTTRLTAHRYQRPSIQPHYTKSKRQLAFAKDLDQVQESK